MPSSTIPLITIVVGVSAIAAATSARRGPLISPFSTSLVVLVSIFGIRPLFMMSESSFEFYGYDISKGFNDAADAGLLAVTSLTIGYFVAMHRPTRRNAAPAASAPVARPDAPVPRLEPYVYVALALCAVWVLGSAAAGGGLGFLDVMFQGRSDATKEQLDGVPAVLGALPTSGAILLAAGRIRIERIHPFSRSQLLMYWVAVPLTFLPPMALGTRRFLLPAVIAAAAGAAAPRWNRRVSLRAVGVGAVGLLVLTAIPYVRSAGSRTGRTDLAGALVDYFRDAGWSQTMKNYFLSYDTEMFSYVALLSERIAGGFPLGVGRWMFGDLLLAPLPRGMLTGRGLELRSDQVLAEYFGTGCYGGACPVPSFVGVAVSDFGLYGVPICFVIVGVALARAEIGFARAGGVRLVALLTVFGFAPVAMRGSSINLAWIAVNAFVISAIAERLLSTRATSNRSLTGRRAAPAPRRHRDQPDQLVVTQVRRVLLARLPWGVIDYGLAALSNTVAMVVAGRWLSARELGQFAVFMSVALITIGVSRSWTSQPLLIASSAQDLATKMGQSTAALVGTVRMAAWITVGGTVALIALGVDGTTALLACAGIGVVIVQDLLRYLYFLIGRAWGAALCDGIWLVATLGLLLWASPDVDRVPDIVVCWSGGALIASSVALIHLRRSLGLATSLRRHRIWFRDQTRLAWGLLADSSLVTLYGFSIPLVLAVISSVQSAGQYRLAQTVVGPIYVITAGAFTQHLPRMVQDIAAGTESIRVARRISVRLVVAALCYASIVVVLPDDVAIAVFGEAWRSSRGPARGLLLSAVVGAAVVGALLWLRSHGRTSQTARIRLLVFPGQVALTWGGIILAGATGAALGLALGNLLALPVWWRAASRCRAQSVSTVRTVSALGPTRIA